MADVLVMHPDVVNPNPTDPGAWLAGMVVDVFPDGQLGPGTQQDPAFIIVRIPGVPVEQVRDVVEAVTEPDLVTGAPITVRRREYSMAYGRLSQPVMNTIRTEREITVGESQFRAACDRWGA